MLDPEKTALHNYHGQIWVKQNKQSVNHGIISYKQSTDYNNKKASLTSDIHK